MDETEVAERLVRLEMKMEAVERYAGKRRDRRQSSEAKIDALVDKITRYESKFGGASLLWLLLSSPRSSRCLRSRMGMVKAVVSTNRRRTSFTTKRLCPCVYLTT